MFHPDPDSETLPENPGIRDFIRFASHPNSQVRQAVARHPDCPPDILSHLAADDIERVYRSAVSNPRLPRPTVEAFLQKHGSKFPEVLHQPTLTDDEFESLIGRESGDGLARPNQGVRQRIATTNPSLPEKYLRFFHSLGSNDVARHPNCPPDILDVLARRPRWEGVTAAGHPRTSPDVLASLAERSTDLYPSRRAANNPSLPDESVPVVALRYPDTLAARRYAAASGIPPAAQSHLCLRSPLTIRAVLADNPGLDPEVIDRHLTRRGTPPWLLAKAAGHPNTSDATLLRLASHGAGRVERPAREALTRRGMSVPPVPDRPPKGARSGSPTGESSTIRGGLASLAERSTDLYPSRSAGQRVGAASIDQTSAGTGA